RISGVDEGELPRQTLTVEIAGDLRGVLRRRKRQPRQRNSRRRRRDRHSLDGLPPLADQLAGETIVGSRALYLLLNGRVELRHRAADVGQNAHAGSSSNIISSSTPPSRWRLAIVRTTSA